MGKMSVTQQRFLENAVLIAALQLIFKTLEKSDTPLYSLSEIANTTSGGTPDRGRSEYYEGDIPWIKSGELNDGVIENSEEYITNIGLSNSSAKIYPVGTLVVALYGATVGKTGILAMDAASNQAVCAVTPINEDINKYFLFWFLRYKRPEFLKSSFGGAQPNISQKILRETVLPLPSSKIQKQICAYLEAIEARLKGKNSVIVPDLPAPLSKIYSTVQKVEELAAKIEEARGLRREAVEAAEIACARIISNLEFEQKDWTKVHAAVLDKKGSVRSGPFGSQLHHEEFVESGVAAIGTRDVQVNQFKLNSGWYVDPEKFEEFKRYQVFPGDVLGTIVGGSIGRFCVTPEDAPLAFTTKHIMALTLDQNKSLPEFLSYMLNFHSRSRKSLFAQSEGSAQPSLNSFKILNTEVPLPSLDKQRHIISYLDVLSAKIKKISQLQANTKAELDALLPSILDKAFKGEL